MLSPGLTRLEMTHMVDGQAKHSGTISVNYVPLLQNPPLHLAILVASDSPCFIDCPPHKAAGVSSAHSDLNAAIAKFRMTAYMWQALIAEDMMKKGFGRRTFRLDEQWDVDTTSQSFFKTRHDNVIDQEGAMRSTAKVHIIRSTKSVAKLRDPKIAEKKSGPIRDKLFNYFKQDLHEAGGPFTSSACPIVAGLVLDSHYDMSKRLVLGHAPMGDHDPDRLSLGMMGSHLTYAWPRFLEEITACLTDDRPPGDKVWNDEGDCGSIWEACSIGQGAALDEVARAFGSRHLDGIMKRGYVQDWRQNFLVNADDYSAKKPGGILSNGGTAEKSFFNDADAIAFRLLRHFRLPQDAALSIEDRDAYPKVFVETGNINEEAFENSLLITAPHGVIRVAFDDERECLPTFSMPFSQVRYTESQLKERGRIDKPLSMRVTGYNSKETFINYVWRCLPRGTQMEIPGTSVKLSKRSISAPIQERDNLNNYLDEPYQWAHLLREKGPDGKVYRATSIDLRVGEIFDGAIIRYADGHTSRWGPVRVGNRNFKMGGDKNEKIQLPLGVGISRIELNISGPNCLAGVRLHLANGKSAGELNADSDSKNVKTLEPAAGETIVGFFGMSTHEGHHAIMRLGIFTVPRDLGLDSLPEEAFDCSELRNTADMYNECDCQGSDWDNGRSSDDDDDDDDDGDGDGDDDTMDCEDEN